jgi:1-aminocyclopropane-1-carboxylate deaminase/D-cysteine desulfhydrase-like pyridoxal-dependent ACC family enzyme
VPFRSWGIGGGDVSALEEKVRRLPRAGIHRWPVTVWQTPTSLHPQGTPVTVAEEHGGFAFGGNKVRQVDVLLGEALKLSADCVITSAGPQSNLCRVIAAGARATGIEPFLVLRGAASAEPRGNQLLYGLTGAQITWLNAQDPYDTRQHNVMVDLADRLRAQGRRPVLFDVRADAGTTCALASTAIIGELEQALPSPPERIVMAGGAGNTAAGMLAALAVRRAAVTLEVAAVASDADRLRSRILTCATSALEKVGISPDIIKHVPLEVTDSFLGAGHGAPTPEGLHAQTTLARTCGIFLDLTYTAKAMAAVLARQTNGPVLFLHTGGGPTVFASTGLSA